MKERIGAALAALALASAGCSTLFAPATRTADPARNPAPACCLPHAVSVGQSKASATEGTGSLLVTRWLPPAERNKALAPGLEFTDEEGSPVRPEQFAGQLLAVSFIYTRCQNPNKCARVTHTMTELQDGVQRAGLGGKVRLLLVTYDPEYDTAPVLKRYGAEHRVPFAQDMAMLHPAVKDKEKFFDEWEVAVNFNSAGVNIHGLQLLLFDKRGRWVRTHHTLIWDNAEIIEELRLLASESG
jgi:protein SCO1